MKNLLRITSFCLLLLVAMGCEEDNGIGDTSNVVTWEAGSPVEFVEIEGTKTASVSIYTGNIAGSDRSYGVSVDESTTLDASAYSVPTSVTVPGGTNVGVLEYQITDSNIPLAGGQLVINISDAGNQEFTYTDGEPNNSIVITVQYENCPPSNSVTLDITFDDYAGETSWDMFAAGDLANPIASGDDYTGGTFTQDFCFESGDYVFTIYDSFGDGICCSYGNGSYSVTVNSNVVASGGSFGASESTSFTVE